MVKAEGLGTNGEKSREFGAVRKRKGSKGKSQEAEENKIIKGGNW